MNKFKKLLTMVVIICGAAGIACTEACAQQPIKLKAEENAVNMDMVIKDNFVKAKYASAEKRFMQGNVRTSHEDYADLISRAVHDDYVFLAYGMKMAEYGFFDLSDELINKLDNNIYTENYVNEIKKFYYPSGMVEKEDLLFLSDAYAAIMYNDLAIETTSELLTTKHVGESDYKNYLIALGYYKSNELQQALKYIDNAVTQNNVNIRYKLLKAKILADLNKPKLALKTIKEIKKTAFLTSDFQDKIRSTEEYVLYKVAKEETLKDYHLAYYYHLQGKGYLAAKVLQGSILQAKQYTSQIFGLLSRVYYENDEPIKAQEFASRSFKENHKNYLATLTLADLSYEDRKFEDALSYYKKAKRLTKENTPAIGVAKSYLALDNEKKSKKLFEKMLKKNSMSEDLLISSLKVFPQRADDYLVKIASLDVLNNDVWLGLAGRAISDGNYSMAETYLNNAYYIDENNFKYYYYLSQVYKAKGDMDKSNKLLIKCSALNSDYNAGMSKDNIYEK